MKFSQKFIIGATSLLAGAVIGFFFGKNLMLSPQIYHANALGSQIIQINALYSRIEGGTEEAIQYNKDMLLIIDCGSGKIFERIKDKGNNADLKLFFDGVSYSFEFLEKKNINLEKLNTCNNGLLNWWIQIRSATTMNPVSG